MHISETKDIDGLKNEILNIFYNNGFHFCGHSRVEIDGTITYKNPFWTFQITTKHEYTPRFLIKIEDKKVVEVSYKQSDISKLCEEFYKMGFIVKGEITRLKLESVLSFTVKELKELLEEGKHINN